MADIMYVVDMAVTLAALIAIFICIAWAAVKRS
jgi:hypothetical protein